MAPAERLDVAGHFWQRQSTPNWALHLTAAADVGSGLGSPSAAAAGELQRYAARLR